MKVLFEFEIDEKIIGTVIPEDFICSMNEILYEYYQSDVQALRLVVPTQVANQFVEKLWSSSNDSSTPV